MVNVLHIGEFIICLQRNGLHNIISPIYIRLVLSIVGPIPFTIQFSHAFNPFIQLSIDGLTDELDQYRYTLDCLIASKHNSYAYSQQPHPSIPSHHSQHLPRTRCSPPESSALVCYVCVPDGRVCTDSCSHCGRSCCAASGMVAEQCAVGKGVCTVYEVYGVDQCYK